MSDENSDTSLQSSENKSNDHQNDINSCQFDGNMSNCPKKADITEVVYEKDTIMQDDDTVEISTGHQNCELNLENIAIEIDPEPEKNSKSKKDSETTCILSDGNKKIYIKAVADKKDTTMEDEDTAENSTDHHQNSKSKQAPDLCDDIPGLYRLLDLCMDEGSNGLVDKIIISDQHVKRLCNELVPNSFKSISKIDYKKLNSKRVHLIGCYGRNEMIAKFLLNKNIIDQTNYELLISSTNMTLRPDFASSNRKKNLTNMHRYLTKLTEHQICIMSETDLDNIDWNEGNYNEISRFYDYQVTKSQEQKENFELHPGFKVHIQKLSTRDNNLASGGIPLHPLIIESISNQTLLTREILPVEKETKERDKRFDSIEKLREYFKMKFESQKCALHLSRKLKMKDLEIIKKAEVIEKIALQLLSKSYSRFEEILTDANSAKDQNPDSSQAKAGFQTDKNSNDSNSEEIKNPNQTMRLVDEATFRELQNEYSHIYSEIQAAVKRINDLSWQEIKKRYIFARVWNSYNQELTISDIFFDKTKDLNSLVKKIIQPAKEGGFQKFINFLTKTYSANEIMQTLNEEEKNTSDEIFIRQLIKDNVDIFILKKFFEKYENWRMNIFPHEVKRISQKILSHNNISAYIAPIEHEFGLKERDIELENVERICVKTELKYPDGEPFVVLDLEKKKENYRCASYKMLYKIETTRPARLRITLLQTQLSEQDTLELEENEFYIPQPILCGRSNGNFFEIDPEVFEFRHIAQVGKKFIVFLWNKNAKKLEIYFEVINCLAKAISSQKAVKKINSGEHFMISVNELKGLIGIYNNEEGVLNTYKFEQDQTKLYLHYRNIKLYQWYNDVPDIAHFFFIKSTEDICFVERDGRARIYNLVNDSFRPGIAQIPPDTINVCSTPDGTCIVAFVEKIEEEIVITSKPDKNLESKNETQVKKLVRGYVYFCEKFSERASKIVDISFIKSPEMFQFSMFKNRQMHLATIDQEKGTFNSSIVKITHRKAQYRFEKQPQQKALGKVIVESQQPYDVVGKETHFTRSHVGDLIVIGDEKKEISEIITDTVLRIFSQFDNIEYGVWKEFSIETRKTINGLFDVYSMVFTKYAVTNPIGRVDNPLSLTVVVDNSTKNLEIKKYTVKVQKYIEKMFSKFEKVTEKPLGHLEYFSTGFTTFQDIKDNFTIHQFGEWMVDFFCLIPLQIAVARDGEFIPLQDGLSSSEIENPNLDEGFGYIGSVCKAISFGWYEAIFETYAHLEVKVISSMGEQSCGKSYLLNHLLGSTFDGSAKRCTEGVWMSLVKTNETLYVALDFEGLASIERTPQEETFLQLFNAALSNLVLFKSQFAVSRDISSMFQRFQDRTNYFKDDPDIFQARFCIIIKDVAESDRNDIVSEFYSKFSKIVDKEEQDNFITKLYRNEMTISPWPVFNKLSFYTTFKQLKMKIDEQGSKYKNAKIFVEKIKVLMTKLKVCDWESVQGTLITIRTLELKKYMKDAISQGFEQKDDDSFLSSENTTQPANDIQHLMYRDDGKSILDPELLLSDIFDNVNHEVDVKLMPDAGLILLKDNINLVDLSLELRNFFEENIQARDQSSDSQWFYRLETFYKFIIDRRIKRVQQWFSQNTSRFPDDHNEIIIAKYVLEQEITRLKLFWNFCRLRCDNCGLACLKASQHNDNENDAIHDCLTDHGCHSACRFQEIHLDETIPKCAKFAGHEGYHTCSAKHSCGASCVYSGKRNCQSKCTKDIDHETMTGNEVHLCEATRHYCGALCSLRADTQKGNYECRNTCIIPCEESHEVHKCENEVCPIECPIAKCRRRCESRDHFHAKENVDHFCGEEHQCPNQCEGPGICKTVVEPTEIVKEEAEYVNKYGSFKYTKHFQNSQRFRCCIMIPPYKFKHEGKHAHGEMHKCNITCPNDLGKHIIEENKKRNFHFCDVKCPHCDYYCTLPYDHGRKDNSEHDTIHGNMFLTTFTCDDEEFEFEGHRLVVGDGGDFVCCHKVCENKGRHRHIDFCKHPAVCKNLTGGKKEEISEHIDANISPYPNRKKDFISHRVFWERTKFRDFKKCDHECVDEIHHKDMDGKVPIKRSPFFLQNPETNFHIVFVVDRSGSMGSSDCKPRRWTIKSRHNNRLGAVYEAVYTFIKTRKNSGKATRVGRSTADRDITSLILFNDVTTVAFENQSLSNTEELLNKMMESNPCGGTSYYKGIKKAAEIIENSKRQVLY
ncbi:10484_t:CDS:10 [Ambispora gerdemannii]|uniref:10484_t:CDS:1 n=1 Tax=Ambispora gerdemannii TaxID=144530 RepID=A0A9N9AZJ4_9GLOM|nr:10484_t:CDS:10 [Ambispora gerdemannii]